MNPSLLRADDTLAVIIDVQGRLARLIDGSEKMIAQIALLVRALKILEIPLIWNEQVPDKLGETVPELKELLPDEPISKTCFSCAGSVEFMTALARTQRNQVLVAGIETHVCVHQTVQQLCQHDYEVNLLTDAVGSRNAAAHELGIRRAAQSGALLSNVEMALFELMVDAQHPRFRDISKLLKEASA